MKIQLKLAVIKLKIPLKINLLYEVIEKFFENPIAIAFL